MCSFFVVFLQVTLFNLFLSVWPRSWVKNVTWVSFSELWDTWGRHVRRSGLQREDSLSEWSCDKQWFKCRLEDCLYLAVEKKKNRHTGTFVSVVRGRQESSIRVLDLSSRQLDRNSGWNVKGRHLEKYLILQTYSNRLVLYSGLTLHKGRFVVCLQKSSKSKALLWDKTFPHMNSGPHLDNQLSRVSPLHT